MNNIVLKLKSSANPLTINVAHHIETSQLICNTDQFTGFYMMDNTGRKWVKDLFCKCAQIRRNLLLSLFCLFLLLFYLLCDIILFCLFDSLERFSFDNILGKFFIFREDSLNITTKFKDFL